MGGSDGVSEALGVSQQPASFSPSSDAPGDLHSLAERIANAQEKVITVSYDKAAAYTTVIVFGGYAGIFGIWQLTKEYLSKQQALWAALLILISLTAFVLFEVYKMIRVSSLTIAKAQALSSKSLRTDPQRFLEALTDLEATQHAKMRPYVAIWVVSVSIAVVGAFGGAGVLAYAFVSGLAR